MHEYQIVGRKLPTAQDPQPKLYRMRLFTPNVIVAKSRFWYFLSKTKKMKRATGEIVACNEVRNSHYNGDHPRRTHSRMQYDNAKGHSINMIIRRSSKRTLLVSKTSVYGYAMILAPEHTTCTRNTAS